MQNKPLMQSEILVLGPRRGKLLCKLNVVNVLSVQRMICVYHVRMYIRKETDVIQQEDDHRGGIIAKVSTSSNINCWAWVKRELQRDTGNQNPCSSSSSRLITWPLPPTLMERWKIMLLLRLSDLWNFRMYLLCFSFQLVEKHSTVSLCRVFQKSGEKYKLVSSRLRRFIGSPLT